MTTTGAPVREATAPDLTGVLDDDARELAGYVAAGEETLAGLPPKAARDGPQRQAADRIHAACRAARHAFLARHVDAVYDLLTDGRTRYPRLPALVRAAAERFPGLVPSAAQMDAERRHLQAEKEGREIDQGIFCAAVLRSATAGRHLIDAMLMPTPRALGLLADFRRTGVAELDTVLVERRGPAAEVTFRNAHCLNAEDTGLIADLETAVDLALLDDQVRVGVLRGGEVDHPRYRGRRVFSAGINLKDLRNGAIPLLEFLLGRELGYLNKMCRGLLVDAAAGPWSDRTVAKPWIGAVDSFAIGGGMQLLLVLDRVIAERDAYVSLPAAEEGIVPGLGNLRLTRLTGARLARQMVLGGRSIPVASAEGRLICDEVVEPQDMPDAIDRAVRELGAPAVAANRRMLVLAEEPLDVFREYLAEFAYAQVRRAYSDDVLAKVERRWQRSGAR
ncbi:(3,5-dihydroxyphenyl)acetyl-CoA 1,2-dioxygenase DpgC [Micromonospora sp. WMMD714]|uniref:(3,5-dihydroxyphenyl)acetyl-CoA 1,2-dioxygenase DpgC n=1 Tax=Micromonospora sp. WMMD714 TaxID=3016097 RepID=UPI002499C451|nr:(3,5-dihydroxyphenyl)acetyl-CoA 1,2-dioxygenase DpgC [Micromonospora sp. WMMD714]WFE65021.1 enoyl-CoA hydratase/isomerase family protein [Micromonospora sp. WMMD714]